MGRRGSGNFPRRIAEGALCVLLLPTAAHAQDGAGEPDSPPKSAGGQRSFGVGPTLGLQSGTGAMMTLGDQFGAVLSGGYMPIFTSANHHETGAPEFDLYSSAQLNLELTVVPWHPSPRSALGLVAGYKFNTLLGSGSGAAVSWRYDLGRKAAFFGLIGLSLFPDAGHQLVAHGYPTDRDLVIPWLQGGFNAGIMVYP